MANDINTGADKLIERILDDARADAELYAKQAEESCAGIIEQAEREEAAAAQMFEKQRDEAVKAILERSRTNAELYARKQALAKRRMVLESVFNEAYSKLCAYDDNGRRAVIRDMILKEAEGGEAVKPAGADRMLMDTLLPSINLEIAKNGKALLSLSGEDAKGMEHGFILAGDGFEKDCSFWALLRDARMLEDTNVSGILFD